eukprot:885993-Rhodomonas_salina.1
MLGANCSSASHSSPPISSSLFLSHARSQDWEIAAIQTRRVRIIAKTEKKVEHKPEASKRASTKASDIAPASQFHNHRHAASISRPKSSPMTCRRAHTGAQQTEVTQKPRCAETEDARTAREREDEKQHRESG